MTNYRLEYAGTDKRLLGSRIVDEHGCPVSNEDLLDEILRLRALCEPVSQTPKETAFWERVEGGAP